jgi:hypothetical protein
VVPYYCPVHISYQQRLVGHNPVRMENYSRSLAPVPNGFSSALIRYLTGHHHFMCDAAGECATVEFLDGRAVVHRGNMVPVTAITNDTYQAPLEFLRTHAGFGGAAPIPQVLRFPAHAATKPHARGHQGDCRRIGALAWVHRVEDPDAQGSASDGRWSRASAHFPSTPPPESCRRTDH